MNRSTSQNLQPCAVVGAGDLVSHIHRRVSKDGNSVYSFNLFRIEQDLAVSQSFRPEDLRQIVKSCQVLAFTIADDGWLANIPNQELLQLVNELDEVTQKWSDQ